jgi:hypothetical protein
MTRLDRLLVYLSIALALSVGALVWYVEIYHELPSPTSYMTRCFRINGKVIYEDTSRWIPSSRSSPYITCLTKGLP